MVSKTNRSSLHLAIVTFILSCASATGDFQSGNVDASGVDDRCLPPEMSKEMVFADCMAQVVGVGWVDVENDYLPSVVACENGNAPLESLRAQAIAARSYLYYRLGVDGSIRDGQSDQVYTCSRPPNQEHFDAVRDTSGLVLRYQGVQVASFYVAGAKQNPPSCEGGSDDVFNTERFVTVNDGASGSEVMQSTIGLIDPSNLANRGCMSQEGANCLATTGRDALGILRFYYGADIEVAKAIGECILEDECGET